MMMVSSLMSMMMVMMVIVMVMMMVMVCRRVLAGLDPHHHAELLLRVQTPASEDASAAGAETERDQS